MANLFDYLDWRGDISFDEVPFGKIDALLCSQLAYLNFSGLVSSDFREQKSIAQAADDFFNADDFETRKYMGMVINKKTPDLLKKAAGTRRFAEMRLCGYVDDIDEPGGKQFSAVTFVAGKLTVIAFRGTDDTIVGWKEDFDIAYLEAIPSQLAALDYFNKAAAVFKKDFILAGHSKGGNLAVNTAARCPGKIQKKISAVYNFDGTGFPKEFFDTQGFRAISERLYSVYPSFCIVGMIFYHPEHFQIVKSTEFAVMQHCAVSWQILGSDFVPEYDFTEQSAFFHKSFNAWMDRLEKEDRGRFVQALFDVIWASEAHTVSDINANMLVSTTRMLKRLSSLDKETKKEIHVILRILAQVVQSQIPLFNQLAAQK